MESSGPGQGSGNTQAQQDIAQVLDPGLWGERSANRLKLLRDNIAADNSAAVDTERLQTIAAAFDRGQLTMQMALDQYKDACGSTSRWPILVIRPRRGVDADHLERRLKAIGLQGNPSLSSAYQSVNLTAVRVPPEAPFIRQLAADPDVDRIERSWLKGSAPQQADLDDSSGEPITHPDHLIEREVLASELLSKRDPLRVGLVDSGIDGTHAALKTRVMEQRAFRRGLDSIGDQFGHGTAAAGIIARLCASAYFMSAKVLDKKGRTNLDDLIRAIAWLKRHRPDVILCNVIMPLPADGRSILSGMLQHLVEEGIPVLVPTGDSFGSISAPADAPGIVTISPDSAATDSPTTVRAFGGPVLCPRSIQASEQHFVRLDAAGWTALAGPGAAAATAAAAAALLIRAGRLSRHTPSPDELSSALSWGHKDALFSVNHAIKSYIGHLVKAQALDNGPNAKPFRPEAVTAVSISARAPLSGDPEDDDLHTSDPGADSYDAFPSEPISLANAAFEPPTISMPVPTEKLERDAQRNRITERPTPEHMKTLQDMRMVDPNKK